METVADQLAAFVLVRGIMYRLFLNKVKLQWLFEMAVWQKFPYSV